MGEKANKRELLLLAAQQAFFERGYHNVTSEEIAKQAGVGKGTLYEYFESKQALFEEVLRLNVQQYYDSLVTLIDADISFAENLRRLVHYHLENLDELGRYAMRFMGESSVHEGHVLAENAKVYVNRLLGGLVEAGIRRGELRPVNAALVPGYLVGVVLGLLHSVCLERMTAAQKAELEDELMEMMLHGLAAR